MEYAMGQHLANLAQVKPMHEMLDYIEVKLMDIFEKIENHKEMHVRQFYNAKHFYIEIPHEKNIHLHFRLQKNII